VSAAKKEQGVPKVGSIAHALAILRHLSAAQTPQGVTTIARALGISPSSCFNILKTLAAEEYVDFNPQTKAYSLGWAPVVLARRALDPDGVLSLLMPEMEEIADRYNIACGLGRVTRNERIMLIGFSQSETATRIQLRIGHRTPVLAGASGRAVAAARGLSQSEILRGFNELRWQNPPGMDEYLAQVEAARQNGWAVDCNQSFRGVTTIAAPIQDDTGEVRFVLSATMFSGQYSDDMLANIGRDLASLAQRASSRFFGPGELPASNHRPRPTAEAKNADAGRGGAKPAPSASRKKVAAAG
jgi:DNA-binding IclR family transcriptional regulator